MTTVCIETAEGKVFCQFENIELAMKQIGAVNLDTLRRWLEHLEAENSRREFETSALAHVEGLESAKELEPGTCRVCMRPILNHSESQKDACIGKLRKARETTAELVSRVAKESK